MLASLLTLLQGKKTYLSALGLIGLAAYQLSTGDYATGLQTLLAAFAAIGVRDAIARQPAPAIAPSVRPADTTPDHSLGRETHASR